MAHFAKLNEKNIVVEVIVVHNNELLDENGIEQESKGIEFLTNLFGHSNWKQTSYNGNFRKHYAGIGFTYDQQLNAFIPPKLFASWLLNPVTLLWEAPFPYPDDGKNYEWNDTSLSWVEIINQ